MKNILRLISTAVLLSLVGVVNAADSVHAPAYSEVIANLRNASVPIKELGADGKIGVTLAAGRVVAMGFSSEDVNLLWSHPQLADTQLVKEKPETLTGGFGGDRLWFAPELAYNWDGEPNWSTFANYKTPAAVDPGNYKFINHDSRSLALRAAGQLPEHGTNRKVYFEVYRTIRVIDPPLPRTDPLMRGVSYVGIETSHVLKVLNDTTAGRVGLWHLLQVPIGSILIVPIKNAAGDKSGPLSYGLPGSWVVKKDHIMWRYGGEARAKFGLSAEVVTGRSAIIRELSKERWCVIVRDFPVRPDSEYSDHPYGVPRDDQVFQAWDGFGFGEMEFHSPVLDVGRGTRELSESDRLWAFGGAPHQIVALAKRLLSVDVSYVLANAGH